MDFRVDSYPLYDEDNRVSRLRVIKLYLCFFCPFESSVRERVQQHFLASHKMGGKECVFCSELDDSDGQELNEAEPNVLCNVVVKEEMDASQAVDSFFGDPEPEDDDDYVPKMKERKQVKMEDRDEVAMSDNRKERIPRGTLIRPRDENKKPTYVLDKEFGEEMACPDCFPLTTLPDHEKLVRHLEQVHKDKNPHFCNICRERFDGREKLYNHLFSAHPEKFDESDLYYCPTCEYAHLNRRNTVSHYERMHGAKNVKCPYCDFVHVSKTNIKSHIRRVHEKHKITYNTVYCDQCPFTARFQSNLNHHVATVHMGDRTYWKRQRLKRIAPVSGRKLKELDEMEDDSNVRKEDLICEECGFSTHLKGNLKSHQENVHMPRQCPDCNFSVIGHRELFKHRRLTHYPRCPNCCFISRNSDKLDEHQCKNHRTPAVCKKKKKNTKPCPDCGIIPGTTQRLNRHIATVHQKLRPYACDQCDFKTARKDYLVEHVNGVHLNLKRECPVCQYRTANIYYFRKHQTNCEKRMKMGRARMAAASLQTVGVVVAENNG